MQNTNYVDIDFIIEKFNREKVPNSSLKEAQVKELVFEALRKIGSISLFEAANEEIEVKGDRVKLPNYINYIMHVTDDKGIPLVKITTKTNKLTSRNTYIIKGKYLYTDLDKVNIEYMRIPTDDKGRPLVLDNEYVISAVVSYLIYQAARRLWLTNRLSGQKYIDIEQEWLYYVNAAGESVDTPSFDEIEGYDVLQFTFPISRLERNGI